MEPADSFMMFLKRYAIPLAALLYVLGFVAKLHEYVDKLGWRLVTVTTFAVASAWAVYVWSTKEMTTVEPRMLRPRYGRKTKVVAVLLVAAMVVPVWLAVQPVPEFRVPALEIRLTNSTKTDVQLAPRGEFYLTASETPAMDVQVANGRLGLRPIAPKRNDAAALVVPAGGTLVLLADVLNPRRFERFLADRELSMRIVLFQSNGAMLTKSGIPFDEETLVRSYVELAVKSNSR